MWDVTVRSTWPVCLFEIKQSSVLTEGMRTFGCVLVVLIYDVGGRGRNWLSYGQSFLDRGLGEKPTDRMNGQEWGSDVL